MYTRKELTANVHHTERAYALQLQDLDEYLRRAPNGELSTLVRENIQRLLSSDESALGAPPAKPRQLGPRSQRNPLRNAADIARDPQTSLPAKSLRSV